MSVIIFNSGATAQLEQSYGNAVFNWVSASEVVEVEGSNQVFHATKRGHVFTAQRGRTFHATKRGHVFTGHRP